MKEEKKREPLPWEVRLWDFMDAEREFRRGGVLKVRSA